MRDKFTQFMQGRYGIDSFSKFLLVAGIVCMFLSRLFHSVLLNLACWGLLIYLYFRMFSKNISKRYAEEQAFLRTKEKVKAFFKRDGRIVEDSKTHRIYRCPQCKQKIRVPRGKGKIEITCPKCSRKFIKRT